MPQDLLEINYAEFEDLDENQQKLLIFQCLKSVMDDVNSIKKYYVKKERFMIVEKLVYAAVSVLLLAMLGMMVGKAAISHLGLQI